MGSARWAKDSRDYLFLRADAFAAGRFRPDREEAFAADFLPPDRAADFAAEFLPPVRAAALCARLRAAVFALRRVGAGFDLASAPAAPFFAFAAPFFLRTRRR